MLESTPGSPYTGSLTDLLCVENNMRVRYACVTSFSLAKRNDLPFPDDTSLVGTSR